MVRLRLADSYPFSEISMFTFFYQIEGSWAGWSFWSRCDNRCGGGNQTRSRSCGSNPTETNAIHPVNHFCNGSSEEKKMCQEYDFDECSLHEIFVPGKNYKLIIPRPCIKMGCRLFPYNFKIWITNKM